MEGGGPVSKGFLGGRGKHIRVRGRQRIKMDLQSDGWGESEKMGGERMLRNWGWGRKCWGSECG